MRAAYPVYLILLDLITFIILDGEYKSWNCISLRYVYFGLIHQHYQIMTITYLPIVMERFHRNAKLWVFTAMRIHVAVLCIMTPCNDVVGYQHLGGPCCLHLQGEVKRQHGIWCMSELWKPGRSQ
jgi:hypothetical protein